METVNKRMRPINESDDDPPYMPLPPINESDDDPPYIPLPPSYVPRYFVFKNIPEYAKYCGLNFRREICKKTFVLINFFIDKLHLRAKNLRLKIINYLDFKELHYKRLQVGDNTELVDEVKALSLMLEQQGFRIRHQQQEIKDLRNMYTAARQELVSAPPLYMQFDN